MPLVPDVVIVGDIGDPHAAAVSDAVQDRGHTALVLDASSLEQVRYTVAAEELLVEKDGSEWSVPTRPNTQIRGYVRRLATPGWRSESHLTSLGGAIRSSWMSLLVSLIARTRFKWLTPIDRLFLAEHKLLQQRWAEEIGVATPETVVLSDRRAIPTTYGDRFVIKPVGPNEFVDERGETHVFFAQEIDRGDSVLDELHSTPFFLQMRVEAARHLRVVTVQKRAWVCVLDADELPLDWRKSDAAHNSFKFTSEFENVGIAAIRIADKLGVGYSSQDWIITRDGTPFFLDLNPGGQWLFLPAPTAEEITAGLSDWLVGP